MCLLLSALEMLESREEYERELALTDELEAADVTTSRYEVTPHKGLGATADPFDWVGLLRAAAAVVFAKKAAPDGRLFTSSTEFREHCDQLRRFEAVVETGENHGNVAVQQSILAERVLRVGVLVRSAEIADDVVAVHEKAFPRELLEGFYGGKFKPTLGITEFCTIGVRRCLERDVGAVRTWVERLFDESVPRQWGAGPVRVADALANPNFGRFVGRIRERYRNPGAHGEQMARVEVADYAALCTEAYGYPRFGGWVQAGMTQIGTAGPGWLGMLVAASVKDPEAAPKHR